MNITYSSQFLYQDHGVSHGISDKTISDNQDQIKSAIDQVTNKIQAGEYGFTSILNDDKQLADIHQVFQGCRWAKTLVVVGIGGSDLGARAVQQALEVDRPPMEVIFHGDSTDPVQVSRLLQQIDLEETIFCIISKSGETIETISQYVLFKNFVKAQTADWANHFLFITDAEKGLLRTEADEHGVATLNIPGNVGGRFSVQTTVGLLPAMAMGVTIEDFLTGGKFAVENYHSLAAEIARDQFLLYQQGIHLNVIMPYSVQLDEFGRWYRQLWAESLGKDGKGVLPIAAHGPADQHSQVQYYNEGRLMHSVLFLRIEERLDDFKFDEVDVAGVEYLLGHSFHEIINVEQQATALSMKKFGRPTATLSIEQLDTKSLGGLFLIFEMAVVYLAEMLEVNAFDQPGVEEGKQMMYALLGREGWEEKKQEIENL